MKFGFMTCVQLGLACMEEIYRVGGRLDLAITLHDHLARKKSGRVYVDDFCARHNIDLVKVGHVNDSESIEAIHSHDIDWLFIIGWSQIAGKEVLNAPRRGCIGMHPTLLPEGRGRAAIPWAILKGLNQTGVTMFKLDEGVDTGPIIAQEVLPLAPDETATMLYDRVAKAHQVLIRRVWPDLVKDAVILKPQDESQATEWPGRKPEDGIILPHMTTAEVDRLVRAVTRPYPGAFVDFAGKRYTLWAGKPHQGEFSVSCFCIDEKGNLWIQTSDGSFEATDWEAQPSLAR